MIKHLGFFFLNGNVKKIIPLFLADAGGETFPRSVPLFPQ